MTHTFGHTTDGANSALIDCHKAGVDTYIRGTYFECPFQCKVISISAYISLGTFLSSSAMSVRYAIYAYDPLYFCYYKIAHTQTYNIRMSGGYGFNGLITLAFSTPPYLEPHMNYFLCAWGQASDDWASISIHYDNILSNSSFYKQQAYTKAWPITITGETQEVRLYSIYSTITQDTRPGFPYSISTP